MKLVKKIGNAGKPVVLYRGLLNTSDFKILTYLNTSDMTDRKQKLIKKLLKEIQVKRRRWTVLERIHADIADFYEKFFNAEGPGVVVYAPDNTENSMYYMTTKKLITGLEDLSSEV